MTTTRTSRPRTGEAVMSLHLAACDGLHSLQIIGATNRARGAEGVMDHRPCDRWGPFALGTDCLCDKEWGSRLGRPTVAVKAQKKPVECFNRPYISCPPNKACGGLFLHFT